MTKKTLYRFCLLLGLSCLLSCGIPNAIPEHQVCHVVVRDTTGKIVLDKSAPLIYVSLRTHRYEIEVYQRADPQFDPSEVFFYPKDCQITYEKTLEKEKP